MLRLLTLDGATFQADSYTDLVDTLRNDSHSKSNSAIDFMRQTIERAFVLRPSISDLGAPDEAYLEPEAFLNYLNNNGFIKLILLETKN